MSPILELTHVRKRYGDANTGRLALDDVSLSIETGELLAIVGTSGSGKSTFLHVAGGLDVDYEGSVRLDGRELRNLRDGELSRLRGSMVGYVFQGFHLVNGLTVAENVAMPADFAPRPTPDLRGRVREVLAQVGLEGRMHDTPSALSGGQRQRVAIARALLMRPRLLLCDEPTGSLDTQTGEQILGLFREVHGGGGITMVMVTHEERVAGIASRTVRFEMGRVVAEPSSGGSDP